MFRASLFTMAKTWKQGQCPLNLRRQKLTVIHSCNRLQQDNRKEETPDLGKDVDESQKYHAEHKKLESNDSIYIKPKSRQNYQ